MNAQGSPVALTRSLQELVEGAMPLVNMIAVRRRRRAASVPLEDFVACGYAVLVEMAPGYDPTRGRFDAYVTHRVHGAMVDLVRQRLRIQRQYADLLCAGALERAPRGNARPIGAGWPCR